MAESDFPFGHTSVELLQAEARRSLADPWQADEFIDMALGVVA